MKKKIEVGRSMVEMLGVLTIMGLVGMIGVKMYTSAMNKHRANELIYEAQKRATMVAMQITAGQENLSVANFQNPTGYVFGVEKNPNNANQFNITITGVAQDVCTQMKTAVGDGTAVRVISEFCDKLTFNNDLSTMAYASDIQTPTECANVGHTWCGGAGVCWQGACCEGRIIGPCETCSEGAIITTPMEGKSCSYDNNGTPAAGTCHHGICIPLQGGLTCENDTCACSNGGQICNWITGACCEPNEVCTANGDVNMTGTNAARCVTASDEGSECTVNDDCKNLYGDAKPWCTYTVTNFVPTKGTCKALGNYVTMTIHGLGEVVASMTYGNWFNARSWCEAKGMHLINVEQFGVYINGGELLKTGKGTLTVNACAKGKNCTPWSSSYPANAMWKGNGYKNNNAIVLTDARDENGELYRLKYSPIVVDLAQHFRHLYGSGVWTASDLDKASYKYAYAVHLDGGYVNIANPGSGRGNTQFYPLCQ